MRFLKSGHPGNLKQIGLSLNEYQDAYKSQIANSDLQREFDNNWSLRKQADEAIQLQGQEQPQLEVSDNRPLLMFKCATQPLSRSKNVVTQLNANFDANGANVPETPAAGEQKSRFNLKWLEQNRLQAVEDQTVQLQRDSRVGLGNKPVDASKQAGAIKQEATRAANDLGKKVAEDAKAAQSKDGAQTEGSESITIDGKGAKRGDELGGQVQRYQMRLEQQQQAQLPNAAVPQSLAEEDRKKLEDAARRFSTAELQTKLKDSGAVRGMMGGVGAAGPGGGPGQVTGGGQPMAGSGHNRWLRRKSLLPD